MLSSKKHLANNEEWGFNMRKLNELHYLVNNSIDKVNDCSIFCNTMKFNTLLEQKKINCEYFKGDDKLYGLSMEDIAHIFKVDIY